MEMHNCRGCGKGYRNRRSLSTHLGKNPSCNSDCIATCDIIEESQDFVGVMDDNSAPAPEVTDDDDSQYDFPENYDDSLLLQFLEHEKNGWKSSFEDKDEYIVGVELLSLLRKTRSPLYIFDAIIKWAQRAVGTFGISFTSCYKLKRKNILKKIERRFDLSKLSPRTQDIYLAGIKCTATLVFHDFRQCLYSLLTDTDLMKEENLLLGPNGSLLYEPPRRSVDFDDINTGKCYRQAYDSYIVNPETEILCPIIFFADKTHTDIHGRLCLEPVQFTLGIFNREARNKPMAWRTLGYITDLIKKEACESHEKMQDYHDMLNIILASFKDAQKSPIIWTFNFKKGPKTLAIKIPVLFVIGDTEGHDKLCARYLSRRNPTRLCRYCNVPFNETDNPFVEFQYQKCKQIERLTAANKKNILKEKSIHCVNNAWTDIDFCDSERGIFGATLAELLHCLQQGIFEYGINALYTQKKIKKGRKNKKRKIAEVYMEEEVSEGDENDSEEEEEVEIDEENNDDVQEEEENSTQDEVNELDEDILSELDGDEEDDEEEILIDDFEPIEEIQYSAHYVFPKKYCATFDTLCRQYGKTLQHQSDRDLPRTFFNSSYISIAKKMDMKWQDFWLYFLWFFRPMKVKINWTKLWEISVWQTLYIALNFCYFWKISVNNEHTI